ncbi:MAG TPA: two-component regulator propeller domain-containing protein [Saprospiraceae bacterium]|nr:two-component regulator propeller domain-containing protein [Saprospiraceae bacterium]
MRHGILILFLFFSSLKPGLTQHSFTKNYHTGDGLPSNYLYFVLQDRNGYIWISSDVGVSRFDGQSFTNFNTSHGLPDNEVFSMLEDRDGRIWFATLNGKSGYFYNGRMYNEHNDSLLRQCNLKGLTIRLFQQDDGRIVYAGTFKTMLIDLEKRQVEERRTDSGIVLVWKESANRIGGANWEIGYVEPDGFRMVSSCPRMAQAVQALPEGDTLLVSSNRSLYTFDRKTLKLLHANECLPPGNQFIFMAKSGAKRWVGTRSGAYLLDAKTQAFEKQYLPGRTVSSVLEDREGGIWFTTFEEGLFYVPDPAITQYSLSDGLLYKRVTCLSRDAQQRLWIGSEGSAFSVFDGKTIQSRVIFQKIVTNKNIRVIRHYPDGTTLVISKAGTLILGPNREELLIHRASDLALAPDGNLWGGLNGLYIVSPDLARRKSLPAHAPLDVADDNSWYGIPNVANFKGYKVEKIEFDDQRYGWVGTHNGLFRVDSAAREQKILPHSIRDLYFQASTRQLWALSESSGLFLIKDGQIQDSIAIRNQFGEVICRDLCVDDAGKLWIGTASGLFMVQERGGKWELTNFWGVLGLGWDKINAVEVVGNLVYIGKDDGLLAIPTHTLLASPPSPPVLIKSVQVNNQPRVWPDGQSLVLQYGEGSLNIAFEGLSYREPQYIRYRYRLSGLDTLWRETASEALEFASLRPGKYRFEVFSVNGAGEVCPQPAVLLLEVLPPFWLRAWFYILLAAVAGLLLFGYIRWRENRLRHAYEVDRERIEISREKAELQKKIADLKMLALRLQMNPHFIFNALNTIKGYYGQDKMVEANAFIGKFARLLRLNLDYSDALIPLDQEMELLRIYLQLSQIRYPDKISFSMDVSPDINPMDVMIPSMLLQPFVENAVIHGLAPKSTPGEVLLSFRLHEQELWVSIQDTGVGREAAAQSKLRNLHKPLATRTTLERLELIRGKEAPGPALQIEDLYDNGRPTGTLVTLRIPIQYQQEPHDQRYHH